MRKRCVWRQDHHAGAKNANRRHLFYFAMIIPRHQYTIFS